MPRTTLISLFCLAMSFSLGCSEDGEDESENEEKKAEAPSPSVRSVGPAKTVPVDTMDALAGANALSLAEVVCADFEDAELPAECPSPAVILPPTAEATFFEP